MQKIAQTKVPISNTIANRWSPRAFAGKPVEEEKITAVLEAARWTSSAFNEQPWHFVVGKKGDNDWKKILETLVAWNRQWAKEAPVLILNIAKQTFTHNGEPNEVALYDLGQAVSAMALEAVNQGLVSHQMTGFDGKKAGELFQLPDGFKAVSATAVGYYGNPDQLPDELATLEHQPRKRKSLDEIIWKAG